MLPRNTFARRFDIAHGEPQLFSQSTEAVSTADHLPLAMALIDVAMISNSCAFLTVPAPEFYEFRKTEPILSPNQHDRQNLVLFRFRNKWIKL
jgi:hypothetical protein